MKRITLLMMASTLLASCGSYKYYQPTTNSALFQAPGEVQVTGEASTSGLAVKAAGSLPKNIGIMAMYKGGALQYRAREAEFGVGYYTHAEPRGLFALGGMGFGSNYEYTDSTYTNIEYEGSFIRPFMQINMGIEGGRIGSVLKGDVIVSLKAQRFYYRGAYTDGSGDQIRSSYSIFEPAFVYGLGTKNFRIQINVGFPFRPSYERLSGYSNARTFPASMGFGMRFIFNRKEVW